MENRDKSNELYKFVVLQSQCKNDFEFMNFYVHLLCNWFMCIINCFSSNEACNNGNVTLYESSN